VRRPCGSTMQSQPGANREFEHADDTATVLVVTDRHGLREAVSHVLRLAGYRVETASHSGHALLACLRIGRVDFLAAELWMDDTSGPRLAQRLRRLHPRLQAVYFANSAPPAGERVLVRPFTSGELLAELEDAAGE